MDGLTWGKPSGESWIARERNVRRADSAERAVRAFREAERGELDESALYDLVCNLGHLADRLSAEVEEFELSFEQMIELAAMHYEAERGLGDDLEA
jgi:hypothetical protein